MEGKAEGRLVYEMGMQENS